MSIILASKDKKGNTISMLIPPSNESSKITADTTDHEADIPMPINGKDITRDNKAKRNVSIIVDFNIVISSLNISLRVFPYLNFNLVYVTACNNTTETNESTIKITISILVGGLGEIMLRKRDIIRKRRCNKKNVNMNQI